MSAAREAGSGVIRRCAAKTMGGPGSVGCVASVLLVVAAIAGVVRAGPADPIEEMPALAVDDAGRPYLVTVATDVDAERTISVFAIDGDERTRLASLTLPGATGVGRPSAVGLADGVLVAWATQVASGPHRIVVARVGAAGPGRPTILSGDGSANILPAVARSGDRIAIVWESNADSRGRTIRFAWIEPGGGTTPEVTLSSPGWNSGNPTITASRDGALFVSWESFRDDGYDLFGTWYRDGRWSPERRLTTDLRADRHARLASRAGAVWIAWESSASAAADHPLDVQDHAVVVAEVAEDGSLHETMSPYVGASLGPPAWPKRARPPDPQYQSGLFRPQPTIDRDGRVWVSARQVIDLHGGWAPVVRSYEGDVWSDATIPLARGGRWHAVPAVSTPAGIVVAVQHDEQPTDLRRPVARSDWASRVEVRRLPLAGAARPPRTRPLTVRPGGVDVRRRRHASNAAQPRQRRRHAGRDLQLFWGNLHAHSAMSVCNRAWNPPPLDVLTIERDLDQLDFCALTDHGFSLDRPMWRYTRELIGQYRDPGRFLPLLGQEWTSGFVPPAEHGHAGEPPMMRHGHHNIIFEDPGFPRFYDANMGPSSPAEVAADIGAHEFVMIPHGLADWQLRGFGNPPVSWADTDEVHQPLAEIYQRRGSYECLDCPLVAKQGAPFRGHYLQDAWAAGVVIGVIAAPDHGGGDGYAGVWATELTEASLFEAFHARHTFGTTGEKIALFVSSREAMMGDKVLRPAEGGIPIDVSVTAGAAIQEIVVLRNNEPVFSHPGGDVSVEVRWIDEAPPDAPVLWYYVRVTVAPDRAEPDARARLAWSSPIWFFETVPPPRRFEGSASPRP